MEAMRQSWTDDRLDDLSHRMDERFDQVEGQIADSRVEMRTTANSLQSGVKELRGEIKASTDELREEIKEQGRELRGEIAGVEARLHARSSEHFVKTEEEFGRAREEFGWVHREFGRVHEDMRQLNAAIVDLHRTMARIGWSAAIALVAAFIGMLFTNL
jgi:chromosome segregation ATPase